MLDDGPTAPATVSLTSDDTLELTIHEGRNRQVRRMCEAVGHPVIQLHRSRYAGLDLGELGTGEWRELTAAEIAALAAAGGVT
jgi:23S rRNA pseudouridine2605 synthase